MINIVGVDATSTRAGVQRYKVEPCVMAADVYSEPPHFGRGGWTWYTGAAGWMYQAGIESILGFRLLTAVGIPLADDGIGHRVRVVLG